MHVREQTLLPPVIDLHDLARNLARQRSPVKGAAGLTLATWCRELSELVEEENPRLAVYALLSLAHGPLVRRRSGAAHQRTTDDAARELHDAVGAPLAGLTASELGTIRIAAERLNAGIRVQFDLCQQMPAGLAPLPWRILPVPRDIEAGAWVARLRHVALRDDWRGPAIEALDRSKSLRQPLSTDKEQPLGRDCR